MKMKKFMKVMAIVLALALTAALSIGLTLAYLTDQDEAVNVMTFGNVDIKQHEYERVLNADGTYETVTVTKADGSTQLSYKVKEFTQAKPLYPAVGTNTGYDSTYVRWEQLGDATKVSGGQQVLAGLNNIQDKFVLVENTGKSDAYVRTVFAFELGSKTIEEFNKLVKTAFGNDPEPWDGRGIDGAVEIDGNRYAVMEYIYTGYSYGNMRHQGGILPAGEWTYNNLAQIYLVSEATNEDCIELDGNGNGTYEILVVSQAVQTEGFSDAKTALDTAFGEITATNHPWSDGVPALSWDGSADTDWYNAANTEFVITTADQLAGLSELVSEGNNLSGKTVKLSADIDLGNEPWTPIGRMINTSGKGENSTFMGNFDGQGHTIYNLSVDTVDDVTDENKGAGLFGAITGNIKNVNVVNANINTAHWAGVIAGSIEGSIENCSVENVTINCLPELIGSQWDNGDKAGAIVGYATKGTITGCAAKNVTITAYRDLGAVVGASYNSVENCAVSNVTLVKDSTHDYKGTADDTTVNEYVGTVYGGATVDATGDVTILYTKTVSTADELAAALKSTDKDIVITLANDIDVPISSLGEITSGSGEYKLAGENTETITLDLNKNKLNITTTYWSNIGAKNDNALFTIKNGTMTSSQATGTWNSYDVTFSNCDYVIEDVVFEKAIAFDNTGKSVKLRDVTVNETHDYYAIWICAAGQNVEIDGLTVNSAGRGLKIDEEYVGTPAKVTLKVSNADFNTVKKGAIMVKSAAGADITLSNVDISGAKADSTNAVWVDEDAKAYENLVTVTGGTKICESEIIASDSNLEKAIENGETTIKLAGGSYVIPDTAKGKTLTIVGMGDTNIATKTSGSYEGCNYALDGSTVVFENITITTDGNDFTGYARCNATYNNCVINNTYFLYGNSVFTDCTFNKSGNGYNIWTYGAPNATFTNCTFNCDGKAIYMDGNGDIGTKLTVDTCVFNDNGDDTVTGKAAIETGTTYGKTYELIVKNTKVNGFVINPDGISTGSTLWANKHSMTTDKLNVVVDGVDVY